MGNIIKTLFILILVTILGTVGVLGYFGFIPGVSSLMGSDKPRDLGMQYSEEMFESGLEKAKVELKDLSSSDGKSIFYEGSHPVKGYFTDDELTAQGYTKDWEYYPVSNLQVRINDDDTCEISGMVKLGQLDNFLSEMGISQEQYKEALEKANIPLRDMPFYAKGFGSAEDNTLDINLTNFEVGRFPVPQSLIQKYHGAVEDFAHKMMKSVDGLSVNEARFENNSIYFDGKLPDIEYTRK